MPNLQRFTKDGVVAVLCSDIHLSHKAPLIRTAEPNWYDAMARPLQQLQIIKDFYKAPIICAGDVFDKWNSPPELINFALECLPKMYSIPGQHDLPYHDNDQIEKSAYWTLAQTEKIYHLEPAVIHVIDSFRVVAFPWGHEPAPFEQGEKYTSLAVVHKYIWMNEQTSYKDAPRAAKIATVRGSLAGYSSAVFGDNHKGFLSTNGLTQVINCGGFMRRNADQLDYRPQVGLLHSSGKISTVLLDCSEDKFLNISAIEEIANTIQGMSEYLTSLKQLMGGCGLDFRTSIERYLHDKKVRKEVAAKIIETLEESPEL